jgi:hypothetical protein
MKPKTSIASLRPNGAPTSIGRLPKSTPAREIPAEQVRDHFWQKHKS